MRVRREFDNPDVVRILESIDEEQLAALLHEDEADAELIAAITAHIEHQSPPDLSS